MKKAIILTYSGYQDQELVYPYYRLLGADFRVDIFAEKMDYLNRIYGILGVSMPCQKVYDKDLGDVQAILEQYDLMVLPGGVKSLEKLRQNEKVIELIYNWNQKNKIIGSTCHGAQLLISANVIRGKNIAAYPSIKDDIVNAGASYSKSPVVVDGNLVTSPHYDHMGIWMETILTEFNKKMNQNMSQDRKISK